MPGKRSANSGRGRGIVERPGDEPELKLSIVLAHPDHRLQIRYVPAGFCDASPQRAQSFERSGAAEIDAELGSRHGDFSD